LEEAQDESNQSYAQLRVKLRLLIFDYDVVEEGNVEADDDGEVGGHLEAVLHMFLSNILYLL
jgi:hypothetical protein